MLSTALVVATVALAQNGASPTAPISKTHLVVLGVDHSAQLVSENDQPGLLTAFIERLRPAAICIERPPELAARGNYYEFTFEVQSIVLPYVASHPVAICPIDWMPSVEDQSLVWGRDLDVPPEVRPRGSFLSYPAPESLQEDFFIGEDPNSIDPVKKRMSEPSQRADRDFPRRLYLYRTFMQAQHIRLAAKPYAGKTVLVVVGYFHKPDLESILANDPAIEVIQASSIGRPTREEAEVATTQAQRAAILNFNLLGLQADSKNVNWIWIARVLEVFERSGNRFESALFRIRLDQLMLRINSQQAAARYSALAESTPVDLAFTWTGVKDDTRLDSYFDPFGNLRVRLRAVLELARIGYESGAPLEAAAALSKIRAELSARQARQLDAYVQEFGIAPSIGQK